MKDFFKFRPYHKTESFYANLSALYLCMSIIFGPIAIIFGLIIFKSYQIYITDMDISVYVFTFLILFLISLISFIYTYKKYTNIEKYMIKHIIKPSSIKETYRDIYVLGTLVVLLLFVTTIYFINNNYKDKINKLEELKYNISTKLNEKVSFTDKYKYMIFDSNNFDGVIAVDKNINLDLVGSIFNYEIDSSMDTEEIIKDFDNKIKVIFSYMNNYKYEEYYNEVNKDLRSAINDYKNGSLTDVYVFNKSFGSITRKLSVSLNNNKMIISLTYI